MISDVRTLFVVVFVVPLMLCIHRHLGTIVGIDSIQKTETSVPVRKQCDSGNI